MLIPEPADFSSIDGVEPGGAAPARSARRMRMPSGMTAVALGWLGLEIGLAVLAPILPIPDPTEGGRPISARPLDGYLLGTDHLGRDMFSRIVHGARTSLTVAVSATGIAMVIGVSLGLAAGFFRRKTDAVIVGVSDVMLAFPGIILLLVIAAMAGASTRNLILGVALFEIPTYIRVTRANTLTFSQREFVSASRGLGARETRIAIREVLPNVMPAIWAYAIASIGIVFLIEGALSFLGLGIQPPTPVWGSMIEAGRPHLERAPHLVLVPSIVMFLTILSFNLVAGSRRGADSRPARLGA
jgi:peptide/nickel transport system permease protein